MPTIDVSDDVSYIPPTLRSVKTFTALRHAHKTSTFRMHQSPCMPVKIWPVRHHTPLQSWNNKPKSLEQGNSVFQREGVMMTRLLRIEEAQEQLSVSRSTIYRLVEDHQLERVYIGIAPRIVSDSVDSYIEELRQPHPAIPHHGGL
jgi:excisionase family DNA binding protein